MLLAVLSAFKAEERAPLSPQNVGVFNKKQI